MGVAESGSLVEITLRVNGEEVSERVEPRLLLLDFVRDKLGLGGTHAGCEQGACGACTVLLEGEAIRSCLLFAVQVQGHDLVTIEGLAGDGGEFHPVQAAFADCHGLQCGFCTPGMIIASVALLAENTNPSDDDVRTALGGNVCRCTGYVNIVKAVRLAAREARA